MSRKHKFFNSDLWSQIFMLLLPFFGFGALYLISRPSTVEITPTTPGRYRQIPTTSRVVIPDALPANMIPTLSALSAKGLADVVNQMAEEPENVETSVIVELVDGKKLLEEVAAQKEPIPTPTFQREIFARGLLTPSGIAVDRRTGNYFVSEENAHRVVMISPRGRIKTVIDQDTRLFEKNGNIETRLAPLKWPKGLSFDRAGNLYLVENKRGGRVLKIAISESGKIGATEIIRVPGQTGTFTWNSVAARSNGELLLTGSNAQGATIAAGEMAQGAIVYRDSEDRWWVPIMRPLATFSGITFSKNGQYAIFCDELAGTVGWLDLQSRYLREGASSASFQSPVGVTSLPDGRVAVAEKDGRISLVDPEVDTVEVLSESTTPIASLVWNDQASRLLAASDKNGLLIELSPDGAFEKFLDRMARARCMAEGAIRHVPDTPPDYLRPLLEMGGLSELNPDFDLAFDELTRRIPILAADARATLIQTFDPVEDPVVHLRFIALDPNRMSFDDPGFDFAISAVILRTKSGKVYKTQLARTVILTGNLWRGEFVNHGTFDLPVPFAYQAKPDARGHAVIHFTGLGRTPDIAIALNPENPQDSYMVLTQLDGTLEQYRLEETRSAKGADSWVVSMPSRKPQTWLSISESLADLAKKETAL